jgi:transcription elongation factor GreB
MSRAFLKDDSNGERPIIPPRPALPPNTPNYVTPQGLEQLREELMELETERSRIEANRDDAASRTWQLTILNGRLSDLTARIASAKVVDLSSQPAEEVRFGATVTLKTVSGGKPGMMRKFTIVGVDEANVSEGKIAFIAPIARAIQGAKKGQTINLKIGPQEEIVEVASIVYQS